MRRLLIDGRNLLWRAAESLSMLSAHVDGEVQSTGAVYGFLASMLAAYRSYSARVEVVWDGQTNFRKSLWSGYKANRVRDDPEWMAKCASVNAQQATLQRVLKSCGVWQYVGEDCEADDVIGALVLDRSDEFWVYSGDADLRQLVRKHVRVVAPGMYSRSDVVFDRARVVEKHGVEPQRIPDLKALAGDPSDNIPGLRGVGAKTAQKALSRFDSLEDLIEAALDGEEIGIPERHRGALVESGEQLRLYKRLTRIRRKLGYVTIKPRPDPARLRLRLLRIECRSLVPKIPLLLRVGKGPT